MRGAASSSGSIFSSSPSQPAASLLYLPSTIKDYLKGNEKEAEIIECQHEVWDNRLNQMITIKQVKERHTSQEIIEITVKSRP